MFPIKKDYSKGICSFSKKDYFSEFKKGCAPSPERALPKGYIIYLSKKDYSREFKKVYVPPP
jgi:hypothetical protein